MSENPFNRLAPFIQEYIYSHRWTELRNVQVEACRVVFETDAHLLLVSGTASGKTEAAFLPVLTLVSEDVPATIGVLYIGPTKALINDQFLRLNDLLKESHTPVCHWHGDVSQTSKNQLLKNPQGVLQITPESLESLLINKNAQLVRLFDDLRFIIIDEVHVFMSSDRGRQVLCQLERLAHFIRNEPRRIGLSATLGDYSQATDWLKSGTKKPVIVPRVEGSERTIRLAVEHFYKPAQTGASEEEESATRLSDGYVKFLYNTSRARKKCLIFANSRGDAESVIAALRQIAESQNQPDFYYVHHGSIATPLREAAEAAMRDPDRPAVTAATVTLELGIDIGQLDRVIQLGSPSSVSRFLQRLGRSGRRGQPSEMWFAFDDNMPTGKELLPDQIPWELLHCIAIIQLYLEERWIEPVQNICYPLSLLYHQTMSTLASLGELTPGALAQRVLTLSPFQTVSQDDFKDFLLHLIGIKHIQQVDEGGLIIGLAGEPVVRNFRFYGVFPDSDEFSVKADSKEVGSISTPPPEGERFALAGRTWEVQEIDLKRKIVYARQVKGRIRFSWHGGKYGEVHTRLLQRMRKALFEDTEYAYLQPGALTRIKEARQSARNAGLEKHQALALGGDTFCLFPWMGSRPFQTFEKCLRTQIQSLVRPSVWAYSPYFITFKMADANLANLNKSIVSLCDRHIKKEALVNSQDLPALRQNEKYNIFIPDKLLAKAFAQDGLDVEEMKSLLSSWS